MKVTIISVALLIAPAIACAGVMKCIGPSGQVTYAESCPGGKTVEIHDNTVVNDGYHKYKAQLDARAAAKAETRAQAAKTPHVNCTAPTVRVDGFGRVLTTPPVCVTN